MEKILKRLNNLNKEEYTLTYFLGKLLNERNSSNIQS